MKWSRDVIIIMKWSRDVPITNITKKEKNYLLTF